MQQDILIQNAIGDRIKQLRLHYNLSLQQFGTKCGLSHVAIFHFESGRTTKPHKATLHKLINVYGTTIDWLLYNTGDMLPEGKKELVSDEKQPSFWAEEVYIEIKHKNELLEKEVERLWAMLNHFKNKELRGLEIA